jgi:sodium/hydrogen antiporter
MASRVTSGSLLFFYGLMSRRLERALATGPLGFAAAGLLLRPALPDLLRAGVNSGTFLRLPEIGLAFHLCTDAGHTALNALRSLQTLPVRPLSTGLLLTLPTNHP